MIRLMRGGRPSDLNNISKIVSMNLPGTNTEGINAIRNRYAKAVMGYRPERLEDLLIEKSFDKNLYKSKERFELKDLKDIPGAIREREKNELRRVVGKNTSAANSQRELYPPINMEYGTAYPELLKKTVKEQVDINFSKNIENAMSKAMPGNSGAKSVTAIQNNSSITGAGTIKAVNRPISMSEKFLMGEVEETVVEESIKPGEKTWVNPMFSPYSRNMESLEFKEKKNNNNNEQNTAQKGSVRLSDAEIRRTADKVFKLVEERIRKERRRIGRI